MARTCLVACAALALWFAACTEPVSDLGSDLLGGDLDPDVERLTPTVFASGAFTDITGAASRVLSGTVDDPMMGAVSATAHLDFNVGYLGTAPDGLLGASLVLRRDYLYGDSTDMLTLAVHDILESWTSPGITADTLLPMGPEVTSFTFLSADSLVEVPLPDSWVTAYEDTLLSRDADSLFHGLALVPVSGQSVVGFTGISSVLELYAANDTTEFAVHSTLTMTDRTAPAMPPESSVVMQDGAGPSVRIEFDLGGLTQQPINGAVLLMQVDTLANQEVPPDFVRPMLEVLRLVAVFDPEAPAIFLAEARMNEEGFLSFGGAELTAYVYRTVFGLEEPLYYELRAPVLDNSLSTIVLHDLSGEDTAPELRLILGS